MFIRCSHCLNRIFPYCLFAKEQDERLFHRSCLKQYLAKYKALNG